MGKITPVHFKASNFVLAPTGKGFISLSDFMFSEVWLSLVKLSLAVRSEVKPSSPQPGHRGDFSPQGLLLSSVLPLWKEEMLNRFSEDH